MTSEQINVDTWNKQKQLWKDLILKYMKHHRLFQLNLDEVYQQVPFYHAQLKRRLRKETCFKILSDLVVTHDAEWINKEKTKCIVWWRKPEEWGQLMYSWASTHGLLQTVCTVYEILHGELSEGDEFHGMDNVAAYQSLLQLEKTGKIRLIQDPSTSIEEYGVKFL